MRSLPNNYYDTLISHGMPSSSLADGPGRSGREVNLRHYLIMADWLDSLHPAIYDRAAHVAQVLRGDLEKFSYVDVLEMIFRIVFNAERPDHCVTALFKEAKEAWAADFDVVAADCETLAQLYMRVVSAMGLHKKKPSTKKK